MSGPWAAWVGPHYPLPAAGTEVGAWGVTATQAANVGLSTGPSTCFLHVKPSGEGGEGEGGGERREEEGEPRLTKI